MNTLLKISIVTTMITLLVLGFMPLDTQMLYKEIATWCFIISLGIMAMTYCDIDLRKVS